MKKCLLALAAVMLLYSPVFAGQQEPDISNGIAVWPQYYNGTSFRHPRVDASTRTLGTVDYEHHEVHAGDHFYTKNSATVASGATTAYLMAISGTSKEVHMIWAGTGSAITDVVLIEGVSSGLKGTKQTIFNNNRNIGNVSGCTFYGTITGGPWTTGTTIYKIKSGSAQGASRTPAAFERNQELILKSGVTYAFLFTSGTNDNLTNLVCEWYEHTPEAN